MVGEREREAPWTLEQLTARVALALSVDYDGQPSGRVREVPDARVVRYYTTLGLVDRPARYDGRVALYGRRHLQQIVAIKRLQQRGRSLFEIQQTLLSLDERALARLAGVPPDALGPLAAPAEGAPPAEVEQAELAELTDPAERAELAEPAESEPAEPEPARRFWNAAPAPAVTQAAVDVGRRSTKEKREEAAPVSMTGVSLSPETVLLATFVRGLDEADVEAIRAAAAPLLKLLEKRGLTK